jgi:hypothetical protein
MSADRVGETIVGDVGLDDLKDSDIRSVGVGGLKKTYPIRG